MNEGVGVNFEIQLVGVLVRQPVALDRRLLPDQSEAQAGGDSHRDAHNSR